ncbi:MAG: ABC transporter ATP-binding protein [Gemmatimonadales bacterium]
MTAPIIQTRGLSKRFSLDGAQVDALRAVDLEVRPGELVVLMGSSGSGKSTLLYLLSGLERSSGGEIHFESSRIDTMDETGLSMLRRTGIGFVFQAINLIPHLTLFENIVVPGYLVETDRAKVDRRALELMEALGIGHLAARRPAQVSGGEQQRAAIARALINRPRAVLADEPTGALNSAAGAAVLESFRSLNSAGQTIVMATHEVKSACIGDRIVYLKDGQVQAELVLADPAETPADREARVVAWLVEQGW